MRTMRVRDAVVNNAPAMGRLMVESFLTDRSTPSPEQPSLQLKGPALPLCGRAFEMAHAEIARVRAENSALRRQVERLLDERRMRP